MNKDDFIRSKVTEEPISESLDMKIENILDNLPEHEARKPKWVKIVPIAASLTFIILVGLAVKFPAYAKEIPIVGSIFKYFQDEKITEKNYDKYASDIKSSCKDQGIEIYLDKVTVDNSSIAFAYRITADEKLKSPMIEFPELIVDGKMYKLYQGAVQTVTQGDKTAVAVFTHSVENLPDKFDFTFKIPRISDIKGNWILKGTVDKTNIEASSKNVNIGEAFETDKGKVTIDKILDSPLQSVIKGSIELNDKVVFENSKHYVPNIWILNEKGNRIDESGRLHSDDDKLFTFEKSFNNLKDSFIQLVLVEERFDEKDEKGDLIEIKNLKGKELYSGKLGTIEVLDVEEKENSFEVKVRIDSIMSEQLARNLRLEDKNNIDKPIYPAEFSVEKVKADPSKKEYTLVYKTLTSHENYKAYFVNPDTTIRPDLDHKYILKLK